MSLKFDCDIAAVGKLAQAVQISCRDGPDLFKNLSTNVSLLQLALGNVEELLPTEDMSLARHDRLLASTLGIRKTLDNLQALISRYEGLGTQKKRVWGIMKWGKDDIFEINYGLEWHIKELADFSSFYQIVVERALNKLAQDFKLGIRSQSVLCSVTAFDTLMSNDYHTVFYIHYELETIGIPRGVFNTNKVFILKWFENEILSGTFTEQHSLFRGQLTEMKVESATPSPCVDTFPGKSVLPANPPREDQATTTNMLVESQPQTIRREKHGERIGPVDLPQNINDLTLGPGESSTPKRTTPIVSPFNWIYSRDGALRAALIKRDYVKARRCLDNGANLDAEIFKRADNYNIPETALFRYARLGDSATVKWILEQGIDPGNSSYIYGRWNTGTVLPLILGRKYGNGGDGPYYHVAQVLLDQGLEIDRQGRVCDGGTHSALYAAVLHENVKAVEWLLDRGANFRIHESRKFDFTADYGNTPEEQLEPPFHAAARVKNMHILQLLLDQGEDVDTLNSIGQSALHVAVQTCTPSGSFILRIITWLLDNGADINIIDSRKKSPLFYAASMEHPMQAVELLIERGASMDTNKSIFGVSAIRSTLKNSHDEMGMLLLQNIVEIRELDEFGNTLLHAAALGACLNSYQYLLALGLDRDGVNDYGQKAYEVAQHHLEHGYLGNQSFHCERAAERLRALILYATLGDAQPNIPLA